MLTVESPEIPRRSAFRAQDVCEIAELQPYVLSSWEAEFPDLGVARTENGPRTYRREDVELVLRIKQLVFGDGLTIAGARRRLSEEGVVREPVQSRFVEEDLEFELDDDQVLDEATRRHLRSVRKGLAWILGVLGEQAAEAPKRHKAVQATRSLKLKRPARSAKVGKGRVARPARRLSRARGRSRPARGKKKR